MPVRLLNFIPTTQGLMRENRFGTSICHYVFNYRKALTGHPSPSSLLHSSPKKRKKQKISW